MRALCLLVAAASLAFAQFDDTITVTASRSVNLQPDQVVLTLSLDTPQTAPLDNVLALLAGTGLTAAEVISVSSVSVAPSLAMQITRWTVTFSLPFSQLTGTLSALTQAQQALSGNPAMNLTYAVLATQVSQELQAAQACPFPALVSAARRQAQAMAAAAGVSVGPIMALSQGSAGAAPVSIVPVIRSGDFSVANINGTLSSFLIANPAPVPACVLTVQFKLLP